MSERKAPYNAFNFQVTFDGSDKPFGGFSDVSGLGTELTVAEYREGSDAENHVRKVPGMHKVTDVTLKRGVVDSTELWKWFDTVHRQGPTGAKTTVTVTLLDEARKPVQSWTLKEVLPMKYTGPTLAAKGGTDVALEELTICAEGFEITV